MSTGHRTHRPLGRPRGTPGRTAPQIRLARRGSKALVPSVRKRDAASQAGAPSPWSTPRRRGSSPAHRPDQHERRVCACSQQPNHRRRRCLTHTPAVADRRRGTATPPRARIPRTSSGGPREGRHGGRPGRQTRAGRAQGPRGSRASHLFRGAPGIGRMGEPHQLGAGMWARSLRDYFNYHDQPTQRSLARGRPSLHPERRAGDVVEADLVTRPSRTPPCRPQIPGAGPAWRPGPRPIPPPTVDGLEGLAGDGLSPRRPRNFPVIAAEAERQSLRVRWCRRRIGNRRGVLATARRELDHRSRGGPPRRRGASRTFCRA
jgi:hypothetical protein